MGRLNSTLNGTLFNILTVNLIVWLYDKTGHCIYAGGRQEAQEKYGECEVMGWRIDGIQFRASLAV